MFFRTGRWARRAKVGPWDIGAESAGLHPAVARWLKSRDVAIVGWDGHGEVMPSVVKGVDFPMHQLLLIAMGTPIFDNCDLEGLAEAAGSRKRWTFLLTASPLADPARHRLAAQPDRNFLTLLGACSEHVSEPAAPRRDGR